jgi:uncharacterized protein
MRHSSVRGNLAALFIAVSILGARAFAGELEDATAARERGDFAGALRLMRPLAEKGNATAQHNVGASYFSGEGVAKDVKEAEKWFRLAAAQGYAPAQSSLGLIKLMSKDYAEALKWNQLAADQGYPPSQVNLAIMYFEGHGVARDPVRAHMWMHLAALQNAPNAAGFRDEIASKLSPAQLEQSLKLAKEWKPK